MLTPRPIKLFLGFVAIVAGLASACAFGAGGEEIYRAKCSNCHDAGMARDIKPEAADGVVRRALPPTISFHKQTREKP